MEMYVADVCRVSVAGCGGVLRGGRCMLSRGRRIKMACGVVAVRRCCCWCVVGALFEISY